MNDKMYIGVTGLAGSGKDALCDMLMDEVSDHIIPHRVALADPLKRTASELFGVSLNHFYDRDMKEEPIKNFGMGINDEVITTPRHLLQQFGTEVVRHMDTNHWVKRLDKEVDDVVSGWYSYSRFGYGHDYRTMELNYTRKCIEKKHHNGDIDLVIIPDVRFENEQQMIRDKGGYIINVVRDDKDVGEMDKTHASETSITDDIKPDFEIDNNQTLSHLNLKAIAVLNELGLR